MCQTIDKERYQEITDLRDIQVLIKHCFKLFHIVCEKNHLIYNMFGGTMLGAVRHGDIIPWDDDIDVTMPREDYDKLESVLADHPYLYVRNYKDKGYAYPYKKVCLKGSVLLESMLEKRYRKIAAYIDVFPADGYPENDIEVENKLIELRMKRVGKVACVRVPRVWWKRLLFPLKVVLRKLPFLFVDLKKNLQAENELLSRTKAADSEFLLLHGANWGRRGKISKIVYYDRVLYPFGDFEVYGIREYDEHLINLYGDYLTLPPEEERVSDHDYRLFAEKSLLEEILNEKQ